MSTLCTTLLVARVYAARESRRSVDWGRRPRLRYNLGFVLRYPAVSAKAFMNMTPQADNSTALLIKRFLSGLQYVIVKAWW